MKGASGCLQGLFTRQFYSPGMCIDQSSSGIWSQGCRRLAGIVVAVTVSMTVLEFAELQKLGADDLRAKFRLARSCEPTVTAVSTDPSVNVLTVAIDCRATAPSPQRDSWPPAKAGS
jgi:hypothetical protein